MKKDAATGISRRGLIAMAGLSAGATLLTRRPLFAAQDGIAPTRASVATSGNKTSFGALKQINAGLLNVGYAEAGPSAGPTVILLHGWPYDIHSFVEVAPLPGGEGLPRDRAVSARLWHDALSFK